MQVAEFCFSECRIYLGHETSQSLRQGNGTPQVELHVSSVLVVILRFSTIWKPFPHQFISVNCLKVFHPEVKVRGHLQTCNNLN